MKNDKRFPHYWICHACATEKGGTWPAGHTATCSAITCKYCNGVNQKRGEFIAPYVDYDWPGLDTSSARD